MTKTVTIPEDEYAALLGQSAFLRAAVHALGGKYEVSFGAMSEHGYGPFELRGDPERQTIMCLLIENTSQEPQRGPYVAVREKEPSDSPQPKRPSAVKYGASKRG